MLARTQRSGLTRCRATAASSAAALCVGEVRQSRTAGELRQTRTTCAGEHVGLPVAATVSVTICPGTAFWFAGCDVIIGRHGIMVRKALELIAVPAALLTITEYAPTLAAETLLMANVPVADPKILPPSARLV